MSLYSTNIMIDGITCGIVMRGIENGQYLAVFEREFASLEDIEKINWRQPEIQGECILPIGYEFEVTDIIYNSALRTYTVQLKVGSQYLGDVTGYVDQVSELKEEMAEKDATIAQQQETIQTQQETIQALETARITQQEQAAGASEAVEEVSR